MRLFPRRVVVDDDGVTTDVRPPEVIKKTPKPAISRMVHYVSYGTPGGEYDQRCRAATITEVGGWRTTITQQEDETKRILHQEWDPDMMGLTVHNPTGTFNNTTVPYDPGKRGATQSQLCDGLDHPGGTWHWPELR